MDRDGYRPLDLPDKLKPIPIPPNHCIGPGLLESLFRNLYAIFPKCFEGAHLKIRKRFKDNIWGGYNQTLSSVHPSNGQLAAELHDRDVDGRIAISPTGHLAFTSKFQINSSEAFTVDAQIKPNKIFVGETTLIHSKHSVTAALTVAAATLPFNIRDIDEEAPQKWNVVDNMVTSVSLQVVKRLMNCWIVGSQWFVGDNIRFGVCRRYHHSDIGMIADKEKLEAFYWRTVSKSVDVGTHLVCPYQSVGNGIIEIGGRWKFLGNQMRCFCTTEGLFGFDFRKRVFETETSHIAIKISGLLNSHNDKFRLGFGLDIYT